MANLLWGQVYYKNDFVGVLRQEPGKRMSFTYDTSYLNAEQPAIAYTLSLRPEPFISQSGLPPFFDNLVAEGLTGRSTDTPSWHTAGVSL